MKDLKQVITEAASKSDGPVVMSFYHQMEGHDGGKHHTGIYKDENAAHAAIHAHLAGEDEDEEDDEPSSSMSAKTKRLVSGEQEMGGTFSHHIIPVSSVGTKKNKDFNYDE